VISINGRVENVNGELALMIPLRDGDHELTAPAKGIGTIEGQFLKIVIQPWLAQKLQIAGGSMVNVTNQDGRLWCSHPGCGRLEAGATKRSAAPSLITPSLNQSSGVSQSNPRITLTNAKEHSIPQAGRW
jgi:hypothetical protein